MRGRKDGMAFRGRGETKHDLAPYRKPIRDEEDALPRRGGRNNNGRVRGKGGADTRQKTLQRTIKGS